MLTKLRSGDRMSVSAVKNPMNSSILHVVREHLTYRYV